MPGARQAGKLYNDSRIVNQLFPGEISSSPLVITSAVWTNLVDRSSDIAGWRHELEVVRQWLAQLKQKQMKTGQWITPALDSTITSAIERCING
jgi:hypothetical protein